jgi:hypothetical protein
MGKRPAQRCRYCKKGRLKPVLRDDCLDRLVCSNPSCSLVFEPAAAGTHIRNILEPQLQQFANPARRSKWCACCRDRRELARYLGFRYCPMTLRLQWAEVRKIEGVA